MKIEISNYLVMAEKSFRALDMHNDEEITFTSSDAKIFDLEKPVPIIVKGVDCVGLADIKSFTVYPDKTTVVFIFRTVSKTTSKAAYTLWANDNALSDGGLYGDEAVPGVYRSRTADAENLHASRPSKRDIPDFLR